MRSRKLGLVSTAKTASPRTILADKIDATTPVRSAGLGIDYQLLQRAAAWVKADHLVLNVVCPETEIASKRYNGHVEKCQTKTPWIKRLAHDVHGLPIVAYQEYRR